MVCVLYPSFLVSAFRVEFDSIRFPSPTIIICRGFDGLFECLSPTIANHHRVASGKLNFMAFQKFLLVQGEIFTTFKTSGGRTKVSSTSIIRNFDEKRTENGIESRFRPLILLISSVRNAFLIGIVSRIIKEMEISPRQDAQRAHPNHSSVHKMRFQCEVMAKWNLSENNSVR